MKILITGGAGFIGGHLSIHLSKRGFDIIALDNLERSSMTKILEENNIEILRKDLRTIDEIPRVDVVIHTAAYIDVAESIEKPYEYLVNNTAVVGKLAKKTLDQGSRIVYTSTAAVYGEPLYIPIDENHPRKPISPYGLSKLLGEEILGFYSERYGLKYTILRLFNVYGPCQNKTYAGVISRFIERALSRTPLVIHGDGSQTRDFIHVEDVARLVEIIVEKDITGVYNVGSGKATSIRKLAEMVLEISNLELDIIHTPPRPGDIKHSVADIRRAMDLGWAPRIELSNGLSRLIKTSQSTC